MIASPADIDPTPTTPANIHAGHDHDHHADAAPADDPVPIPSHFPPNWPHLLVQDLLKPGLDTQKLAAHLGVSFDTFARLITSAEVQAESDGLQLIAATRSRLFATSATPRAISQLIAIVDTPLPHNRGMTPEAESRAYCRHADLLIRAINALARHTRPSPPPDHTRTKPRRTSTRHAHTTEPRSVTERTSQDTEPRNVSERASQDTEPRSVGERISQVAEPPSVSDAASPTEPRSVSEQTSPVAEPRDTGSPTEPRSVSERISPVAEPPSVSEQSNSTSSPPRRTAGCHGFQPVEGSERTSQDTEPPSVSEQSNSTSSPPRRAAGCHGFQPVEGDDSNTSSASSPPPPGRTTETVATRVPLVPVESASADETEPVPTGSPSSPLPHVPPPSASSAALRVESSSPRSQLHSSRYARDHPAPAA